MRGLISPRTRERPFSYDVAVMSMMRLAASRTSRGAELTFAVDCDHQGSACRTETSIIEPHTPDGEELPERHGVGFPTLQPYLARGVVGVHRCLQRSKPVDSEVRRHFHRRTINGDA